MKFIGAITLAASVASTNAFTTTSTVGRPSLSLAATASIPATRKQINGLTKENFDSVLKEVEPFLLNEAGASFYAKSMKRIATQASAFGVSVPADFAKDAKATKKRRERQDAFVQTKISEASEGEEAEAESTDEGDDVSE